MTAFFFFAQAMRFLNHTCILVNVNITEEELSKLDTKAEMAYRVLSADVVGDLINRGAFCNTAGLRMFYLSFPLIAWIGGPWYLIVATVLLVIILRHLDFNVKLEKRNIVDSKKWWMFRRRKVTKKDKEDDEQTRNTDQQTEEKGDQTVVVNVVS